MPRSPDGLLSFNDEAARDLLNALRDASSSQWRDLQKAAEKQELGQEALGLYNAMAAVHRFKEEGLNQNDGLPVTNQHLRDMRAAIQAHALTGESSLPDGDVFSPDSFPSAAHALAFLTDVINRPAKAIASVTRRPDVSRMSVLRQPLGLQPERASRMTFRSEAGLPLVDPRQFNPRDQLELAKLQAALLVAPKAIEQSLTDANVLGQARSLMEQAMQGVTEFMHNIAALSVQDDGLLRHAMGRRNESSQLIKRDEQTWREETTAIGAAGPTRQDVHERRVVKEERRTGSEEGSAHPVDQFSRTSGWQMPEIAVSAVRTHAVLLSGDSHLEQRTTPDGGMEMEADGPSVVAFGADRAEVRGGGFSTTVTVSFASKR